MRDQASVSSKARKKLTPLRFVWLVTRGVLVAMLLVTGVTIAIGIYMMHMPGQSWRGPLPELTAEQTIWRDQLRHDVEALCGFGGRSIERPEALHQSAQWIESRLQGLNLIITRNEFTADGQVCANIIAEKVGSKRPSEIVIIGAHYDSVWGLVGANDNASGVAALLALAAKLSSREMARTVRFVYFVNEEPPHYHTDTMGSLVYAKACRARADDIVAMVALDGLGYYSDEEGSQQYPPPFRWCYPTTANFIGFAGDTASRGHVRREIEAFRKQAHFPSEGVVAPQATPGLDMSDHWSFWQVGYPGMLVTDTLPFRYKYYHTPGDTPERIDYDRMARVVDGLSASVQALAE